MYMFCVRIQTRVGAPFEITLIAGYFAVKNYVRNSFIRSGK